MSAVNLSPIYEQIINPLIQDILQGLALAAVGWVTYTIQKYAPPFLKGYLETKASNDLNTALANGVQIAMHKTEDLEAAHSTVEVKGMLQTMAVQYAVDHASGAIDHFGLNPDQLATKALAYIPTASQQIAPPAASLIPVDVKPLPPIGGGAQPGPG